MTEPEKVAPTMIVMPLGSSGIIDAATARIGGVAGVVEAIAAAPHWQSFGPVTLVVRRGPPALMGVVGRFDDVARARLRALADQLDHLLPRLTYLDHAQVEGAVLELADVLRARFGRNALTRLPFEAVPRGGYVVLGMLAYALPVHPDQLRRSPDQAGPIVVVDDCIVSGRRVRHVLDALAPRRAVIAALVASPEARERIERDPRVLACVSAYDLRDAAPARFGSDHVAWQARWREREGIAAYWIGLPAHVCFPWNEPDVSTWNDATETQERGWPLVPPDSCFKHRCAPLIKRPEVQWHSSGTGSWRPADDVLACRFEGRLLLGSARWPSCLVLEGMAVDVWETLIEYGEVEASAGAIAQRYEIAAERVRADVEGVVAALVARGAIRDHARSS